MKEGNSDSLIGMIVLGVRHNTCALSAFKVGLLVIFCLNAQAADIIPLLCD